ncbi:MAG TPA: hypothetical protein VG051_04890 [Candidatus Acidoferrum sp.]|jgi:hypothetical protein|nr:hypothetical protein [Candidatus Acidoferrum sp.]
MSLVELWKSAPGNLQNKHVQQIISFAGAGRLLDASDASKEFRNFLSCIPSELLQRYAKDCLGESFDDRGFALQDVVNEVGTRLGFSVTAGRYRGTSSEIGFDGLWLFPDKNRAIVVEVKTTDAYKIDLNVLADYRRRILSENSFNDDSVSMLIVLGSENTENLEAQIRGSRLAWGIRLISVDALLRLLRLKEETDDPAVLQRIQNILVPREFTKLDAIIELVFSAAQDVRENEVIVPPEDSTASNEHKPKFIPVAFNEQCIEVVEKSLGKSLIKRSKSKYTSANDSLAVVCTVSREHDGSTKTSYWFAFHPHQEEALREATNSYVAFGCGSAKQIILIPFAEFQTWLDGMNVTETEDRSYRHVSIFKEKGRFTLHRKKGFERIDLTNYLIKDTGKT